MNSKSESKKENSEARKLKGKPVNASRS